MSIVAALSLISVPLLMILMINYMDSKEPNNNWIVLGITILTALVKIIAAFFS